jgi:hypothetical protein
MLMLYTFSSQEDLHKNMSMPLTDIFLFNVSNLKTLLLFQSNRTFGILHDVCALLYINLLQWLTRQTFTQSHKPIKTLNF